MPPLDGIRVLDFSTLLPGPLATLLLAEAGAEVIKIERPDGGDEMRGYQPRVGADSAGFALLNRGKRSLALDLKDPAVRDRLRPLIASSQIVVEQFRPGVMERLGLGYADLSAINPAIVYCAITGYGSEGPMAQVAGHDLNYVAETGLLGLAAGPDGAPGVPPGLIADIGGGALPAVINILMALREAERDGRGRRLDIAMCDGLFAWQFWALAQIWAGGGAPAPGAELLSGGSPRYRIYATADGRHLAVAPLEQRFWDRFTELIGLDPALRDDARDPAATLSAVAAIIAAEPAAHWEERFAGQDVCCAVVRSPGEALDSPQFRDRGLFDARVRADGAGLPALPVPLAGPYRAGGERAAPRLGEANAEFLGDGPASLSR